MRPHPYVDPGSSVIQTAGAEQQKPYGPQSLKSLLPCPSQNKSANPFLYEHVDRTLNCKV